MDGLARVLVVGSYNADLVAFGERIPRLGETVMADRFEQLSGGKGSNQAIAAARLGVETSLIARVGNDHHGEDARRLFRAEGIAQDSIITDPEASTGVAMVLVDAQGQNAIAVIGGANARLSERDVAEREPLFEVSDALLVQLESPLETVRAALALGRRHRCTTILDPAPARPLDDALLSLVDYLTPNESEASTLVGRSVVDAASAAEAAEVLRGRGCLHVIVTLGAKGSVLCTGDGRWHIPAPDVVARDTTGAGDAFSGGLAAGLARGDSPLRAALFATRVAAASVGHPGVVRGLPRESDLSSIPETREVAL